MVSFFAETFGVEMLTSHAPQHDAAVVALSNSMVKLT